MQLIIVANQCFKPSKKAGYHKKDMALRTHKMLCLQGLYLLHFQYRNYRGTSKNKFFRSVFVIFMGIKGKTEKSERFSGFGPEKMT